MSVKEINREKLLQALKERANKPQPVVSELEQLPKKKTKKLSAVKEAMLKYEENKKNAKDSTLKIDESKLNLEQRKLAELQAKKMSGQVLCVSIGDLIRFKQEEKNEQKESRRVG